LCAELRRKTGRGGGKERFKIWDLFADERCSQPILVFLSMYHGRGGGSGEDALSEVSEWELRERREREDERRQEAEELGAHW